jgi:hypothetical protein
MKKVKGSQLLTVTYLLSAEQQEAIAQMLMSE